MNALADKVQKQDVLLTLTLPAEQKYMQMRRLTKLMHSIIGHNNTVKYRAYGILST